MRRKLQTYTVYAYHRRWLPKFRSAAFIRVVRAYTSSEARHRAGGDETTIVKVADPKPTDKLGERMLWTRSM